MSDEIELLLLQNSDGDVLVTDVPDSLDGTLGSDDSSLGIIAVSDEQQEVLDQFVGAAGGAAGFVHWPHVTIRWKVKVKRPRVTVGPGARLRIKLPEVTVGGIKLPKIETGPPTEEDSSQLPPEYNVHKVCRVVDGDAEVYIKNDEDTDLAVVVEVAGIELPKSVVKKHRERMFAKFKATNCEAVSTWVTLVSVGG